MSSAFALKRVRLCLVVGQLCGRMVENWAQLYGVRGNELSLFYMNNFQFAFGSIFDVSLVDRIDRTVARATLLAPFEYSKNRKQFKQKRCGFIGWPIIISIHCNGRTDGRHCASCAWKPASIAHQAKRNERVIDPRQHRQQTFMRLQLLCGNSVFMSLSLSSLPFVVFTSPWKYTLRTRFLAVHFIRSCVRIFTSTIVNLIVIHSIIAASTSN